MPSHKIKILLVGDTEGNVPTLSAIISNPHHTITSASSGKEALRQLLEEEFALILIDLQIPEMDGFETAVLIRDSERTADIPIIFLTACETNDDEILRGYKLGVVDFVRKLSNPEVLKAKVDLFVDLHRKKLDILKQSRQLAIERNWIESGLEESENRFKNMFRKHSAVMLLIEPESGAIIDANLAAGIFYGHSIEDLLAMNIDEINTLSSEQVYCERHNALDEQKSYFIFPHRIGTGEIRTVEVHSTPIKLNSSTLLFSIIHDITERKQAENALKNSEELYHKLFEMESDSLLMLDCESCQIMDVNGSALRIYGYTKQEFLQLRHHDMIAEPVPSELSERDCQSLVPICSHRKKDGTVFPVEITGTHFDYRGRKVYVAAIRDITERLRTEKLLSDLNQRLSDMNEHLLMAQEQERLAIARDIHDDLGQNFTVLKLDLEMIELRIPADSGDLNQTVVNMRTSIDQIVSKIQQIAADLRPPLLDNLGLAAAIGWHVNEIRKRSNIEFFLMLNEEADSLDQKTATVVMRIVQEGLTNIIRHSQASEVSISLCKRDRNLFLEISDNGCGVTSEQIASPKAYGLMGMRERARSCRGDMEIIVNSEGGTTISLLLPLDTEEGAI